MKFPNWKMIMVLALVNSLGYASLPKDGSSLRVALNTNGVVPFQRTAPVQALFTVLNPILGQLLYRSSLYDLRPGLLESYEWDPKKKVYVLTLRPNLFFHNGRKVVAKDLEFSIIRGFLGAKRSWSVGFFSNIEGIESAKGKSFKSGLVSGVKIVNDRTVEIKLKQPNPSFLHSLARPHHSLVPMEELKGDYETWKRHPIGAGPYKVISAAKRSLTIEKVNGAGDRITYAYGEATQNTDIEVSATGASPLTISCPSSTPTHVSSIFFNFNNLIAKQGTFRQAVHHLIDRRALVAGVQCYAPTDEFLASHLWGRITPRPQFDPTSAKMLLRKVKGLDLSKAYKIPVYRGFVGDAKFGKYLELLRVQLSKAGLRVEFFDSPMKYMDDRDRGTLFRILSLGADVTDPLVLFGLLRGDSPLYPSFPSNDKKYESLFRDAEAATTLDTKILSVKKLSQYVFDNKIVVPLFEKKMNIGINETRVKEVGHQDGGLSFLVERVVLKE